MRGERRKRRERERYGGGEVEKKWIEGERADGGEEGTQGRVGDVGVKRGWRGERGRRG